MDYIAYSFDPRKKEATLEDFQGDRPSRFLSPTAQAAAWRREDGEREQRGQPYDILGRH